MHSASAEPRRPRAPTPPRRATRRRLAALALFALGGLPAHAQDAAAPAAQGTPAAASGSAAPVAAEAASARVAAIARAVAKLKADPLMSGVHKTHTLRWNPEPGEADKDKPDLSWLRWLTNFATFLSDTSRILFYGLIAVIVAVLLVSLRHLVNLRSFQRRAVAAAAVSHVRDLDVRPESLPDDIGAAAWALWRAGKVQAALSLLYRGALSRLIHKHAVPISAATTEGECLDLARGHLEPTALRYLTQVVRAWEANIYGNRALSDAMGEALCSGFAARLDAAPVRPSVAGSTP